MIGGGSRAGVERSLDAVRRDLDGVPASWAANLVPLLAEPDSQPGWLPMQEAQQRPTALAPYLRSIEEGRRLPPNRQLIGTLFVQVSAQYVHDVVALALLELPVLRLEPARTGALIARPDNSVGYRAGNTLALSVGDPVLVSPSGLDPALAARDAIVEHAAVVIDAVRSITRISRRAGWSLVAAMVAERLLGIGRAAGAERTAEQLVDRILAPGSPLATAPPRRLTVTVDGVAQAWTCRSVCCLNYLAYAYCTAYCPLVEPADLAAAAIETLRAEQSGG
jgi:hypothetical protein